MFGYNFSMLNYDTVAGGVFGSLQLGWNAGMMHASVYPSLFTYPTMNFGGFTPYQQFSNSNWLLDPNFALQSTFLNMQSSGFFASPASTPVASLPWMNVTPKTDAEKAIENEYKELKNLAKEISKKLDGAAKTNLDNVINSTEGTVEERLEALKTALSNDGIKEKAQELLLNPLTTLKVGSKTLTSILKDLGLGNKPTQIKIRDMNNYCKQSTGITSNKVSGLNINSGNVLSYIEGLENLDLIDKDENKALKDEFIENLIELSETLINSEELDETLQTNLSTCRDRFIGENAETAIFDDFKTLYMLCLLGASQRADKKVVEETAFDDIAGSSVYTDKAKEILKNKGFVDESVTNALTGTVDVSPVPYDLTKSDYYVTMTFDNPELQTAHDAAAAVIAEIVEADPASLKFKIFDSGQIQFKLDNGHYVQFALGDSGNIEKLWVNYQEGGSTYGSDIVYYINSKTSTSYVANEWNSEADEFQNGVKLEGNNSFTALQDACATLVERARRELAEQNSEEVVE